MGHFRSFAQMHKCAVWIPASNNLMFLKLRKKKTEKQNANFPIHIYIIIIDNGRRQTFSLSLALAMYGKFPISLSIDETNSVCVCVYGVWVWCMTYAVCNMMLTLSMLGVDSWTKIGVRNGCCCCYYCFIGITSLPDLTINTWLPAMWMWKILRGSTKCPHAHTVPHIRVYDFQLIKNKTKTNYGDDIACSIFTQKWSTE